MRGIILTIMVLATSLLAGCTQGIQGEIIGKEYQPTKQTISYQNGTPIITIDDEDCILIVLQPDGKELIIYTDYEYWQGCGVGMRFNNPEMQAEFIDPVIVRPATDYEINRYK